MLAPDATGPRAPSPLAPVSVVALITLAVFLPALRCGFVNWDDDHNIVANSGFRGFDGQHLRWMATTTYGGHYQPLTWLSFALDQAVWGLAPAGYHLSNVLWHVLAAALFFFLAKRLLQLAAGEAAQARGALNWCAAFAALIFAIHPLRVESVAWVTERRDVLSGAFFFASLLAYLRAIDPQRGGARWHVLAWLALALSLGAKAIGVTAPMIMLIIDVYPARRLATVSGRRLLLEKIPYAVLSLAAGAMAVHAQRAAGAWRSLAAFGPLERIVTACYGVCFYLWKLVAPHDLSPLYPLPPGEALHGFPYVLALPAVVVLLGLIVALRWLVLGLVPAFLAYCLLLAPVSGVAQSGKHLVADRYSYLALLPFALLAGGGLLRWHRRVRSGAGLPRRLPATVAGVVVIGLSLLTIAQIGVWRDSQSLWRHALSIFPNSGVAAVNLGNTVAAEAPAEALELFSRAVRADPNDAKAHNGLGRVLMALEQPEAALSAFQTAAQLAPAEAGYHRNLGYVLAGFGRLQEAADQYSAALALDPRDAAAAETLAAILGELHRFAAARDVLSDGLAASPGNPMLTGNLAWLLATCPDEAVRDGEQAVTLASALAERTLYADPHVLDTLAAAQAEAGRFEPAVATADAAVRLALEQNEGELSAELRARRALYATGKPYREP